MRFLATVLAFFSVNILQADVIHLKGGGKIRGTIIEITLDGGAKKLSGSALAKLSGIDLGTPKDRIELGGGIAVTGKIEGIVVKSVGGRLSFPRARLVSIERKVSPQEGKLQEYRRKKRALSPHDATGHYQLGLWARKAKLHREAANEFRYSLKANPNHEHAEEARKALGIKTAAPAQTSKKGRPAAREEKTGDAALDKLLQYVEAVSFALGEEVDDAVARELEGLEKRVSVVNASIEDLKRQKTNLNIGLELDDVAKEEAKEKRGQMKKLEDQEKELNEELRRAKRELSGGTQKLSSLRNSRKKSVQVATRRLLREIKSGKAIDEEQVEDRLRKECKLPRKKNEKTTERIARLVKEFESTRAGAKEGASSRSIKTALKEKKKNEAKVAKLKRQMKLANSRIGLMIKNIENAHPANFNYILLHEEGNQNYKWFNDNGKVWKERTKKCQQLAGQCLSLVKSKAAFVKRNRELFKDEIEDTEGLYKDLIELQAWLKKNYKVSVPPSDTVHVN